MGRGRRTRTGRLRRSRRSRLWADESRVDREAVLPSFGQMLADHVGLPDGEAVDREVRARNRKTPY